MSDQYELLDSGNGKKLERFGEVVLERPCAQAVWKPRIPDRWDSANARFDRNDGLNWRGRGNLSDAWTVEQIGRRRVGKECVR